MLTNLPKFDFNSGKINLQDSKKIYFLLKTELLSEHYETGFRFPDEFLLMSLV